jgi:hypothetical protein
VSVALELCMSVRHDPSAFAVGPINRSIEEERPVLVPVRDNNVDYADLPLAILE